MQFTVVMWAVWGVLVLAFAITRIYLMGLSRDEDDQIYLDEAFDHEKQAQEAILARIGKVQPIQRTLTWALGIVTLVVIVYYVVDMIQQFK